MASMVVVNISVDFTRYSSLSYILNVFENGMTARVPGVK